MKVVRAGIEEKEISQRSLIYLVTSFNFVTSALKPLDYRGERNTSYLLRVYMWRLALSEF